MIRHRVQGRHQTKVLGILLTATLLASMVLGTGSVAAARAPAYVVSTLNDDGPGSLRQAIISANSSGGPATITFSVTGTIVLSSPLPGFGVDTTVIGPGAGFLSISGADAHRVFTDYSGTVIKISGLTLRNGRVPGGSGAAIDNFGTMTVRDCIITNNVSPNYDGGGISNYPGGTMTIIDSIITGNSADTYWGGGITNEGTMSISGCTISNNHAGAGGGGIFSLGTLTVIDSAIYDNSAGDRGGGVFVDGGTATIESTTISGNTANGQGGGAIFTWSTVNLSDSTITNNSIGGILNRGEVNVKNSIVAGNIASGPPNCWNSWGIVYSQGYNLESGAECGFTATTDKQNTDPLLGPLALNGGRTRTHALLDGSPALDAGSCGKPADQRGAVRPVDLAGVDNADNGCDIGAYERQSSETVAQNPGWSSGVAHNFGSDVNVRMTPNTSDDPGVVTVLKQTDYPGMDQDVSELPIVWTLSATNDTYDLDVVLCYTADELGQTPTNTLRAYRQDEVSQNWQDMGGTVDTDAGCVTVPNVTALSQWALAGDGYVSLDKTVVRTSGTAYGSITYRIRLHNSDVVSYTDVHLTDTLPDEVDFGAWIDEPSGVTVTNDEIAWHGDIQSKETITFTFVAAYTGDYGTLIDNTAVLSSTRIISDTATFGIMRTVYLPMVVKSN